MQFCWGGKVVALTSGADTPFKVSAQCHPGMIDPEDAAKVTIPMCILASKEEDSAEVEAFAKALKVENHVETFGTQIHGWMSARSDLADGEVKKEYERGYHAVSDFFGKHI
jgi:dienelactone hydrolase